MEITLYQVAKTGRMKVMRLQAKGNELVTEWYTSSPEGVDGEKQSTTEIIKGVNKGKANETTDEQQCLLEFERKVKRKKEEGYVESIEEAKLKSLSNVDIHEPLPKEFQPCKPINKNKSSDNVFDGTWLAERKHNGSCILFHNTGTSKHIYSRTVIEITEIVSVVKEVRDTLEKIPEGSLYVGELVATEKSGIQNPKLLKAVTHDKTTPEKALKRYKELTNEGVKFSVYIFEVFFHKGEDVTKLPFSERRKLTEDLFGKRDINIFSEDMAIEAEKSGWEGFILRKDDATIEFSMNGKPTRKGSYKYKFVYETDVFITRVELGNGKNKNRFSKWYICQYDRTGNLIKCGYTGTGFFSDKEVDDFTKSILDKGYNLEDSDLNPSDWIPIELQYQSRQSENSRGEYCFEFPQPVRIRFDKEVKDCLYEDFSLLT